jgi:hypothetical protein
MYQTQPFIVREQMIKHLYYEAVGINLTPDLISNGVVKWLVSLPRNPWDLLFITEMVFC